MLGGNFPNSFFVQKFNPKSILFPVYSSRWNTRRGPWEMRFFSSFGILIYVTDVKRPRMWPVFCCLEAELLLVMRNYMEKLLTWAECIINFCQGAFWAISVVRHEVHRLVKLCVCEFKETLEIHIAQLPIINYASPEPLLENNENEIIIMNYY